MVETMEDCGEWSGGTHKVNTYSNCHTRAEVSTKT